MVIEVYCKVCSKFKDRLLAHPDTRGAAKSSLLQVIFFPNPVDRAFLGSEILTNVISNLQFMSNIQWRGGGSWFEGVHR